MMNTSPLLIFRQLHPNLVYIPAHFPDRGFPIFWTIVGAIVVLICFFILCICVATEAYAEALGVFFMGACITTFTGFHIVSQMTQPNVAKQRTFSSNVFFTLSDDGGSDGQVYYADKADALSQAQYVHHGGATTLTIPWNKVPSNACVQKHDSNCLDQSDDDSMSYGSSEAAIINKAVSSVYGLTPAMKGQVTILTSGANISGQASKGVTYSDKSGKFLNCAVFLSDVKQDIYDEPGQARLDKVYCVDSENVLQQMKPVK